MTSTESDGETAAGRGQRQLRPGIKMLFVSLVAALCSLGLFVYALGMNQPAGEPPNVRHIPLAVSMLGFGASSLLFWIAFLKLAKPRQ